MALKSNEKIIFLGDSITDAGHCFSEDPLGNGYVNLVGKELKKQSDGEKTYQIMNCGHDGFTIHGVRRMLEYDCLSRNPDIVSLLIGCNDAGVVMNTGKSLAEQQFESCYEEVIRKIKDYTHAKIICMAPFILPYPKEYENWIPVIREIERIERKIAEKYQIEFVLLQDKILEAAEDYGYEKITTDGIHLCSYGNHIVAMIWKKAFEKLVSIVKMTNLS